MKKFKQFINENINKNDINLPDEFIMIDDGHYGHQDIKYICKKNKFIIDNEGKQIEIEYDENFNVIKGKEYTKYNIIKLWNDPRYVLAKYKESDLSIYGLEGNGFVVNKDELFGIESHIIIQFDNSKKFTLYTFLLKKGKVKEIEGQRWSFNIIY